MLGPLTGQETGGKTCHLHTKHGLHALVAMQHAAGVGKETKPLTVSGPVSLPLSSWCGRRTWPAAGEWAALTNAHVLPTVSAGRHT